MMNERRRAGKSIYIATRDGVILPTPVEQVMSPKRDNFEIWVEQVDEISADDYERLMRLTNWPLAKIKPA
jgi:hypothetical protein